MSVSKRLASKGDTMTITVQPDTGYVLDSLTVTDGNGGKVEVTRKSDTSYTFVMPSSKVAVNATFRSAPKSQAAPCAETPMFHDAAATAYYYDAVNWAVAQGVTSGTGASKRRIRNLTHDRMKALPKSSTK